jgi:cellulose synthase operon protein C
MTFAKSKWAAASAVALVLLLARSPALAQPPATQAPAGKSAEKSPPAAVRQFRDAVAFQDRGVYDLAADEWQEFLDKFPTDPLAAKARHYLGVCQLLEKKYPEAASSFERALREHPESELADASYLNLGLAQYSQAQTGQTEGYDQAAATLQILVEKFPQSKELPEALYYLGEALYARDKKPAAAEAYEQLSSKFAQSPRRAEGLYALGVTRQDLGQNEPAAAAFDKFLKDYPQHSLRNEVVLRRAETFFAEGNHAAAEKWFASAAAAKDFAHADLAAMRQAASLVAQKKLADAAVLYATIPARFPQSTQRPAALLAAANNYFQLGQWDDAVKAYAEVAKSEDALALEATHGLARTYLKQQQPAEALAAIDLALPKAKGIQQEPQLRLDRADALYELPDRRGEAIAAYAAIAEQFPEYPLAPRALYMAAFASLGQGDFPAATRFSEAFLKAHADDPLSVDVRYIAAEAALQQKQYAAAAAAYRELLAKSPQHADAAAWTVRLGLALYLDGKFADVVAALSPLTPRLEPAALAAEGRFLLGSAQAELGQHDAAIQALQSSLTADATGTRADEALLTLATVHHQKGQSAEAIAALRKLTSELAQSTRLERAYMLLGDYAAQTGDVAAAAKDYQHLLATWPQSEFASHALFGLAGAQLSQQDFPAASATLTKFLETYPQDPAAGKARYARAVARERLRDYPAALEDLEILLASNPPVAERSDALYLQGLSFTGLQQWAPAAESFRTLLKADPKFSAADKVLYELAWALRSAGQEDAAVSTFGQLAEQHPTSPLAAESYYHLGEAAYEAKEFATAAEHYQAAAERAGGKELGEKAAHKRGWALYQQGELASAAKTFQKQIGDYPDGGLAADAQFMVGEALFGQNQHDAALAAYEKSFAQPSGNQIFQALAALHAGQSLAQQQKWEASLKLLDDAIGRFGESAYLPEMQYESGWALQNMGKPDEALARYEQVVAQTDREVSARARFMMGEVLFEKKQYKEAIRNFFKVAYGYGYPESPAAMQVWQANASYEAARCFEVLRMVDQARKSYQEVVNKYPQSDKVPLAKSRLEALGS